MLIVVDTSSLVRFFTDDIPKKASLVEKLFKDEKDVFIPDVVFPEMEYILIQKYQFPREKLLRIYTFLSSRDNIHLTKEMKNAITIFKNSKLDMADCIKVTQHFRCDIVLTPRDFFLSPKLIIEN